MVIYEFNCNCGCRYIGRTQCTFSKLREQHVPKWLNDGRQERPRSKVIPTSSVTKHLMECQKFEKGAKDKFKVRMKVASLYQLKIAEAMMIKLERPES